MLFDSLRVYLWHTLNIVPWNFTLIPESVLKLKTCLFLSYKKNKTVKHKIFLKTIAVFKSSLSMGICHELVGLVGVFSPLVKSAYQTIKFLIPQPKHMLWVLKRTPKTYVKIDSTFCLSKNKVKI